VIGGTISPKDARVLREMGIADVFGVRTPLDELAPRVQSLVRDQR
jgi:methylmalonyl-CoA mutase cobalamin-binding subunit